MAGHAFEGRIYAENVPKGFLPATGVLHHYNVPVLPGGQLCKISLFIYLFMVNLKIYPTFCCWKNLKLQDRFVGLPFFAN